MTPEQALQLLDNMVSSMTLSRADHSRAQQAVAILSQAIKPKTDGNTQEE